MDQTQQQKIPLDESSNTEKGLCTARVAGETVTERPDMVGPLSRDGGGPCFDELSV